MNRYHYTESGLKNVWIENIQTMVDDSGEQVFKIQNINGLHKAIAQAIVTSQTGMAGPELRFLRTEMGMTQAELAQVLHKEALTLGRWERGEHPIDPNAETVIRLTVIERLGLKQQSVAEVARWSVVTAMPQEIRIDGSDPAHYKLAA